MTASKTITVDLNELVSVIATLLNGAGAISGASATNSAASAGTGRTTSNAEQDAKDAYKASNFYTAEQVDSDTNVEEAYQVHGKFWEGLTALNGKRTYDLHQSVDLAELNRQSKRDEALFNILLQNMQNAVETHNMVGKQAVRHGDLAIDQQWRESQTRKDDFPG